LWLSSLLVKNLLAFGHRQRSCRCHPGICLLPVPFGVGVGIGIGIDSDCVLWLALMHGLVQIPSFVLRFRYRYRPRHRFRSLPVLRSNKRPTPIQPLVPMPTIPMKGEARPLWLSSLLVKNLLAFGHRQRSCRCHPGICLLPVPIGVGVGIGIGIDSDCVLWLALMHGRVQIPSFVLRFRYRYRPRHRFRSLLRSGRF
jgi:hypothetical protein